VHDSVRTWVQLQIDRYGFNAPPAASVLEVGSYDVNGSVRSMFAGDYTGIDYREGPGVDRVMDAERESLPWAQIGLCLETLEHVARPQRLLENIYEAVAGYLLLTCRGYDERGCWPVHDYPYDYWRFSAEALAILLSDAGWRVESIESDPEGPGFFALAS
jgi:hypothetical protein